MAHFSINPYHYYKKKFSFNVRWNEAEMVGSFVNFNLCKFWARIDRVKTASSWLFPINLITLTKIPHDDHFKMRWGIEN